MATKSYKKILLVESDPGNRAVLSRVLDFDYRMIEAANIKAAKAQLEKFKEEIALILINLLIPQKEDGFAFISLCKENEETKKIPLIVLSDELEEMDLSEAFLLGASDIIQRPLQAEILRKRVDNLVDLKEINELASEVECDRLTGLYNKDYFDKSVTSYLRGNHGRKFDVICCDIENIRLINEFFGVLVADMLMRHVAKVFSTHFSKLSLAGRVYGDVFSTLVPRSKEYDDEFFAEALEEMKSFDIDFIISVKFGVYHVDDISESVSVMCDKAHEAASSIKRRYGVNFAIFQPESRSIMQTKQYVVNNLRAAIEKRQITVFFQPKYEVDSEKMVGAEAFARWIISAYETIPPNIFINILERNGLVALLDLYMWEETCRLMQYWIDKGYQLVPISLNLARCDIYYPNLVDTILEIVDRYKIPHHLLHVEVKETAYCDDTWYLAGILKRLREEGFAIEIDDFGTGYSSMTMLASLPVDVLKIDLSFTQNADNPKVRSIINFILVMGKMMNLTVVAEGVETYEQMELFKGNAHTQVQGFLFSHPMPSYQFIKLVRDSQKKEETKA